MKFIKSQLDSFAAYEKVRQSGEYNMFDWRAQEASGLDRDDYMFVMKNYSALKEQYAKERN